MEIPLPQMTRQKSKSAYENTKSKPNKKIKIPPKFFFEISNQIIFHTNNEFFDLLETSITNLQLLFKINRQIAVNSLQNSKYEICEAIKQINILKEKNQIAVPKEQQEKKKEKGSPEDPICLFCEETKKKCDFFTLECSHSFCRECYTIYLNTSLTTQGFLFFQNTNCPMENCKVY